MPPPCCQRTIAIPTNSEGVRIEELPQVGDLFHLFFHNLEPPQKWHEELWGATGVEDLVVHCRPLGAHQCQAPTGEVNPKGLKGQKRGEQRVGP